MNSEPWLETEFSQVEFGDKRLRTRLFKVADMLAKRPEQSICQSFETWGDAKAAYNMFGNPKVSGSEIMRSHVEATKKRIKEESGPVFAIGDTSGIGTSQFPSMQDTGTLGKRGNKHIAGLWMHSVFAVNEQAVPLGFLGQTIWARNSDRLKQRGARSKVNIAKRESRKWLKTLQMSFADPMLAEKVIVLCDREADIYEVFCEAEQLGGRYIIRCQHDRKINKKSRNDNSSGDNLLDALGAKAPLIIAEFEVTAGRHKDKKRNAIVEVRVMPFSMMAPRQKKQGRDPYLEPASVTAIEVREINQPPEGEEAIRWHLLTNCECDSVVDVVNCVKWYSLRWQIEILHRTMKTGFRLEATRFSTAARLMAFTALVSVVAWHIMRIVMLGRAQPEAEASTVISPQEQSALETKLSHISKRQINIDTTHDAVRAIAALGGFKGRKCDKEPGPETVWRGWMRLQLMIDDINLFQKPETYG